MSAPLMPQLRLYLPTHPSAKIFSYVAGSSSSKQNTYSDSTLATANANPLSAAASGLFGPIFLDPALAYHFIVGASTETDPPTGTAIIDQDNVVTAPGQQLDILSKTANYTVLVGDGDDVIIFADATAASFTITLYTAVGNSGRKVRVVKIDSTANTVTIDPNGSQTWNGATTKVLSAQWDTTNGVSDGSNWVQFIADSQADALSTCEGRLTLTSGTPVTTADVTGATSIYFAPYKGNRIALYDGTARWNVRTFTEITIALGTLTSGLPYDLFAYDNAGVVTFDSPVAWTNGTTRATALTTQNGVLVKTGATTRRYIGTFYTTSTTQTEDSQRRRLLFNYYNRVTRSWVRVEGTDTWTYSTATWRQANGSTTNQVELMVGVAEDAITLTLAFTSSNNNANISRGAGIGRDVTNATTDAIFVGRTLVLDTTTAGDPYTQSVTVSEMPPVGFHYWAWVEWSAATATTTWWGDNGSTTAQSGLMGRVRT